MTTASTCALRHPTPADVGRRSATLVIVPNFEDIYRENFSFVWRTSRALGVPSAQIDDAVQEVFVIVHRKLATFRPDSPLRSWLFGIVRRVAKDFRRTERRKGGHLEIKERDLATEKNDPLERARTNRALRAVEAFAETLDDERRAIFALCILEQVPAAQAAQTLGLNVNTVYSRLKVIKAKMAEQVSRHYETQGTVRHED